MDRLNCEANSIRATGVKTLLFVKTIICIGTRIVEPAQSCRMNGRDYAG
jgi:hypothetical protein